MSQLTKHLLGDSHHVGELIQNGQTEQMEPNLTDPKSNFPYNILHYHNQDEA